MLGLHALENVLALRNCLLSRQHRFHLLHYLVSQHDAAAADHCAHGRDLQVGREQKIASTNLIKVGLLSVVVIDEHDQHVHAMHCFAAQVLDVVDERLAVEEIGEEGPTDEGEDDA